jgi:hypothetical protein
MHSRTGTWMLSVALLLGSVGCGDDDDLRPTDAGVSRGGRGGSGGGGKGGGGKGGGGGYAGYGGGGKGGTGTGQSGECGVTHHSLDEWCRRAESHCELMTFDQQLREVCRGRIGCTSELSCVQISLSANSCGGTSIQAVYGIDATLVIQHYDQQGRRVGAEYIYGNTCRSPMRSDDRRLVYGAECERSGFKTAQCPDPAADGGTADAGF